MDTNATPAAEQPADLSARTVTTLVILTLVVAFLGAWMNVQQAMTIQAPAPDAGSGTSSAEVSFRIEPPKAPATDASTGFVAFEIRPPE